MKSLPEESDVSVCVVVVVVVVVDVVVVVVVTVVVLVVVVVVVVVTVVVVVVTVIVVVEVVDVVLEVVEVVVVGAVVLNAFCICCSSARIALQLVSSVVQTDSPDCSGVAGSVVGSVRPAATLVDTSGSGEQFSQTAMQTISSMSHSLQGGSSTTVSCEDWNVSCTANVPFSGSQFSSYSYSVLS